MDLLKKEIKINRKFIVSFVVINFLIVALYYTYAIFVVMQIKENISYISVNNSFITMTSDSLVNNSLTVSPNTSQNIIISLTNTRVRTIYYRLLHEKVKTGVSVFETNSDGSSSGMIEGSLNVSLFITITNSTSEDATVTFKCQESDKEDFDKLMNYSYVNRNLNYDHAGVLKPQLPGNMIPVYYSKTSSTTGVWLKADATNNNKDAIWYDYDNYMWANAVTVSSDARDNYLQAASGTEINSGDINGFFVWIPKFKYYVVSGDGETNQERLINVIFNPTINGTVTCTDSLTTSSDPHVYSEICTDSINGKIYNNLSTYDHPAFNFKASSDGTLSTGFWIGKYATANKDNLSIVSNASINNNSLINTSYIRKMELFNNPYGFPQSSSSTYNESTWIMNDSNNLDIHPIKSMEWGALTILANSPYGKSGNSDYYNDDVKSFTRIYNNPSEGLSGLSTNYTLNSTSVINTSLNGVLYNDLTNVTHTTNGITYPIAFIGPGASTTGTVYGVYDMSGGYYKSVMGIVIDPNKASPYTMDSKYYDAYSTTNYTGKVDNVSKSIYMRSFKLGDGILEHIANYNENGMWQNGSLVLDSCGYMIRGGYTQNGSIFSTKIKNDTAFYATFAVLFYNETT